MSTIHTTTVTSAHNADIFMALESELHSLLLLPFNCILVFEADMFADIVVVAG